MFGPGSVQPHAALPGSPASRNRSDREREAAPRRRWLHLRPARATRSAAERDGRDRYAKLRSSEDGEWQRLAEKASGGVQHCGRRGEPDGQYQQPRVMCKRADVDGCTEPDEEDRPEKSFGNSKKLTCKSPRSAEPR